MEPTAVVYIWAARAIVASNNLVKLDAGRQGETQFVLMDLWPGREEAAFTVLGNIGNGAIHVRGVALRAPWQPLNVLNWQP